MERASVLAVEDEMQQRGANLPLLWVSSSSLVILKAGLLRRKPSIMCADPPSPGSKYLISPLYFHLSSSDIPTATWLDLSMLHFLPAFSPSID